MPLHYLARCAPWTGIQINENTNGLAAHMCRVPRPVTRLTHVFLHFFKCRSTTSHGAPHVMHWAGFQKNEKTHWLAGLLVLAHDTQTFQRNCVT